ncbi:hypothetical protein J2Z66_004066 [Paenibacillus eucommiae]|uniref:Uncharacterized protein n=1 Tax=Paenibacillus eucommiae TaxID=1355755 RepID=A0ABS4IY55_9BACL|nr:hypothetical protein [Paenibacillus eucommiae]
MKNIAKVADPLSSSFLAGCPFENGFVLRFVG